MNLLLLLPLALCLHLMRDAAASSGRPWCFKMVPTLSTLTGEEADQALKLRHPRTVPASLMDVRT